MTLTQLRYVITIADTGSMKEASKALLSQQPSLSQAVKELETEIGVGVIQAKQPRGVGYPGRNRISGIRKTSCRTI